MVQQAFKQLRDQLFRRIGYTVGLSNLLEFARLCELVKGKGSLDVKQLTALVQRRFDNLEAKFARGKIDVARSLGLLFAVRNRYALSGFGRALVALIGVYGEAHAAVQAFWLKRVVESDADLTLTLLLAISHLDLNEDLDGEFLRRLDGLLKLKQSLYRDLFTTPTLRNELPAILVVRDAQPKLMVKRPATLMRKKNGIYESIEIPPHSLPHYVRHTVTPRKGWLADLGLIERTTIAPTEAGKRLVAFLNTQGLIRDGLAIIPPDQELVSRVAPKRVLPEMRQIDDQFYDGLVSATYAGKAPVAEEWHVSRFMEEIKDVYERVKLANFEQAELIAIREAMLDPLLVQGRTIPFSELLEEAVRTFPDKLYRLSSRRETGAYVSLKKSA